MIKLAESKPLGQSERSIAESLAIVALGMKIQARLRETAAKARETMVSQNPIEEDEPESDDTPIDDDNGVSEY